MSVEVPHQVSVELLVALGRQLKHDGYQFITPTPASHAIVLRRDRRSSDILRDTFGWNRGCAEGDLPAPYRSFVSEPGLFDASEGRLRAQVRFSTLEGLLLAHSGFPTVQANAVFFGPDTYRFCRAIRMLQDRVPSFQPRRIIDVGAGSGAGGLYAASVFGNSPEVILGDINSSALLFSRANAILNGFDKAKTVQSDVLYSVEGEADLIVSNPPYLVDAAHRTYRDGGGRWGEALGLRILREALPRLAPQGHLLLYTGSPVLDGQDTVLAGADAILRPLVSSYHYEELDPDVFGEELRTPAYREADRIATIALHVKAEDFHPVQTCSTPI